MTDRLDPTTPPLPDSFGAIGVPPDLLSLKNFKPESELAIEPTPGLYILFRESTIVYIGQSGDIRERLRTHRKEGKKIFDRVTHCFCDDLSERLRLEGILILLHTPKYNRALLLGLSNGRTHEIRFGRKYSRSASR